MKAWKRFCLAAVALMVAGFNPAHAAESGRYVLVKTVIDREKQAGTIKGEDGQTTIATANGTYAYDYQGKAMDGTQYAISVRWTYTPPPATLAPDARFTMNANGSISTTRDSVAYSELACGGDISQGDNRVAVRTDTAPTANKAFALKAPSGPSSRKEFEIGVSVGYGPGGIANEYHYEWRAGAAAPKAKLSARLDCSTLEVLPNQRTESCHIVISGWDRTTANRVEVLFPKQSDGFGSQDKGGRTGLVVPIGQGSESPSNMSGSKGPDGSYGKSYSWTFFVRARGNAPTGTQALPIIVRQKGAGEVKLEVKVRVVPGRGKQSGPRKDGEGTTTGGTTGGTGTRPPVTNGVSRTGLSARLGYATLALRPGQGSESCTLFIKGWRTGTSDQVEIFFPQESKLGGNLGNDLVVFPGSSKVDPANMSRNANGEYSFGLGFRAMERAPGVTTMIDIVIRQEGHEPVRLTLRVAVDATKRGTGSFSKVTAPGTGTGSKTGSTTTPPPKPPTITARDREQADVLWQQAQDLAGEEKWVQASDLLRQALQLNPELSDGWNSLGDMYMHQKKWPEAEKAFREAVRRAPNESYLHAQLGSALLQLGRRDEAKKEAQAAIRLGLEDHELFDMLGLKGAGR